MLASKFKHNREGINKVDTESIKSRFLDSVDFSHLIIFNWTLYLILTISRNLINTKVHYSLDEASYSYKYHRYHIIVAALFQYP